MEVSPQGNQTPGGSMDSYSGKVGEKELFGGRVVL